MFKAFIRATREETSLSRARIGLLTETLLVQGASAIPWPLTVTALFLFDKTVGPLPTWRPLAWLGALWVW